MAKKRRGASESSIGGRGRKDTTIYPLAPHAIRAVGIDTQQLANGLQRFSFHSDDNPDAARTLFRPVGLVAAARGAPAPPDDPTVLSAESAAQAYLRNALASTDLPTFTAPEVNGEPSEFKSLGTEKLPLTGTQTVKFRQTYNKIPVYGSLVTVELDGDNALMSINSSIGDPRNVDPVARVSPAEALSKVTGLAGYTAQTLNVSPRLSYYFDSSANRWRLVYILEDVVKLEPANRDAESDRRDSLPEVVDYIIDAHTNDLVKEVARTFTALVTEPATDGLGVSRTIRITQEDGAPNGKSMLDPDFGVRTCNFGFRSIRFQSNALPGDTVTNPPNPWDVSAVSAHANAGVVAEFMRAVLQRNGVDNRGMNIVCSINCLDQVRADRAWYNAAWYRGQMVYGQRQLNGELRSFAIGLDVAAHEVFHGVTEASAKLEYETISGALNESYSDIFGAIISNLAQPDIGKWNWEIGEDLDAGGVPLRDLGQPSRFGQPEHTRDFLVAQPPYNQFNDCGHVHTNSGIHNLAAFRVITARGSDGSLLFDPTLAAAMFYVALTQHLSRRSTFSDSRRGVELVARSLLRNEGQPMRAAKLDAVSQGFESVGITAP